MFNLASLGGKRVTSVKPEYAAGFDGLLYLLLFCLRAPNLPPIVVGKAVTHLLSLGEKVSPNKLVVLFHVALTHARR